MRKLNIRHIFLLLLVLPVVLAVALQLVKPTQVQAQTPPWPTSPPAEICGNNDILGDGPTATPSGAITVPAGDNSTFDFTTANTTFYFESGVHYLGTGEFSQIAPRDNTTFIGAPGAILDGQELNRYAFTGTHEHVRIAYLEIRNFVAPRDEGVINHDSGKDWTMEYNYIHNNEGGAVFAATDNVLQYNCIKDNGQYGFQAYSGQTDEVGPSNILIDHNEVSGNNTHDWESLVEGCGCTGGSKFWLSSNVEVTNNWIHDNNGVGLWFDNNNRGSLIEHNYIEGNKGQGVFIEAGYDAQIRYNTFKENAIESGKRFADRNDPFPIGAIYVSESGSPEGYGLEFVPTVISHNYFENNWGGVNLWENADRYSGSSAHTHTSGTIQSGDLEDDAYCDGASDTIPSTVTNKFECRWSTQNVIVEENEFHIDKAEIGEGCEGANYCGISGIFANVGTYPEFSGFLIPWRITFQQGNIFRNNEYYGDWHFAGFQTSRQDGNRVTWEDWRAPAASVPATFNVGNIPTTFGQDQGSTISGRPSPTPTPTGGPTATPTPTPTPTPGGFVRNHLNANTETMEGSLGAWFAWFSSAITRTDEEAHNGAYSMKVDITDPYGWGVQMSNSPGFVATEGNKRMSIWAKSDGVASIEPTMRVQWLDENQDVLQTDYVELATLTSTWQRSTANVTAPEGTATVFVSIYGTENEGTMYFDDIVIGDSPDALDDGTASLESSFGEWVTWFSSTITRSTEQAHDGTHSLKMEVTDPYGWGVQFDTWPGLESWAGTKRISYWARQGAGDISSVVMEVKWYDENFDLLQTDPVYINDLDTTWKEGIAEVIAPVGTAYVRLELSSASGEEGDSLYLDDFHVVDITNLLDNDSASFENSFGDWIAWFSSTVATATQQSYYGTHSLKVDVTAPYGWGVEFDQWPGIETEAGEKVISYSGRQGSGPIEDVVLTIKWLDENTDLIDEEDIWLNGVSTDWKSVTKRVSAPAGTTHARLEFSSPDGDDGDSFFLDGFIFSEDSN